MIASCQPTILMVDMGYLSQRVTLKVVVPIQAMVHRTNMAGQHHMVCLHRRLMAKLMASLGLINLVKCLIQLLFQPKHMVPMCPHSNHMGTHQVVQCSKAILLMVQDMLLTVIITQHLQLLLVLVMLSLVHNLFLVMASLVDSSPLLMPQEVMVHIQHSLVTPNNQPLPLLVMGIKAHRMQRIQLLELMVPLLLSNQAMVNHLQPSQAMISPTLKLVVLMELHLHQLVMRRVCHPSLVIRSMTPVRCMRHLGEMLLVSS